MNKEYKQTVEIIKMKMFAIVYLAPSRDSMVDTRAAYRIDYRFIRYTVYTVRFIRYTVRTAIRNIYQTVNDKCQSQANRSPSPTEHSE